MPYYRAVAQAAAATPDRVGVLLVNLGTPDAPTYLSVQRFLRKFLSDRRVIDTSRWLWLPVLYGVVLPVRPIRAAGYYRQIWMQEGSPLAVYTRRLEGKVERRLHQAFGDRMRVALGMTYGGPSIDSAIRALADQNVKRLLVMPLFPQYCSSTTGSVFDGTARALRRLRWLPETRFVNDYYADPGYTDVLAARIEAHWATDGGRSHLVFSYHGVPAAASGRGDPYRGQAEATSRMVSSRLGLGEGDWSHCYQSRFGGGVWLQPYLPDTLRNLAARGVRKLTVVAPSFAVDCLETLHEVGIDCAEEFLKSGGERLSLVPALNDDDPHADFLVSVVRNRLSGWIP